MRNYILLLGLILAICAPVFGEEPPIEQWVARYDGPESNGDNAEALAVDNSGNIYVTGSSYSSVTSSDYATVKYGPDGNQLWAARYNGPGNSSDYAFALAADNSGNVYVTGESTVSGPGYDFGTIKYNSDGNQLWAAFYNGPGNNQDMAYALAVDNSGNVYVTGSSTDSNGYPDYATIKYSPDGNQLWVARYNGPGNNSDVPSALAVDDSGNVYVTGYTRNTFDDYATVKYGPDGNQLWVARYNGPISRSDQATALAVDNSGNVYVTGFSRSSGMPGYQDYATVKYSADGNQLWAARYDGPGNRNDYAYDLAVDNSGNVYVTGSSENSITDSDYATLKYGPDGNQLWVARYDGPGDMFDQASALAVDSSGNVYVTGESIGSDTGYDYATVKYNPNGSQLWVSRYDGPGNDTDNASAIAVDNSDNVYVTGESYDSGTGPDYATIKYDQEPFYIYVDAGATGANDGSTWEDAYNYLQDALAEAEPNHEIWVAQGTYRPDEDTGHPGGTGSRLATFQLINGVALYGGFPSGGGTWNDRNPNTYQTILSGNINVPDVNTDNSYHVVIGYDTNSSAILDGFTITAGYATAPYSGGGMYNYNGSPTLTNCTFSGNSADSFSYGGGMHNRSSSPIITNCIFSGNSAGSYGGGIYNNTSSSPTLTNCTFTGNSATYYGGGICNYNSSPAVTNCIFWGNTASTGPQIYNYGTGSATVSYSDVQGGWEGTGNISANPLIWDTKGHLLSGSPCRNAGDPNGDYSGQVDIDGQPRVLEGQVDIGVDELLPSIQNIDTNEVYGTIQDAIDDANDGETIVVQPGTYTGTGNMGIDFNGKAITLRSAEPNDPNVVAATIIDGDNNCETNVYFQSEEGPNSVLNGFTVANASSEGEGIGSGIYCYQSGPTIKNCIIRNNTADEGSGIYCEDANPIIHGGTIRDNSPDGIYLDANSTVLISGTVHIISNDIAGQGNLQFGPGGSLDLDDAHVFTSMSGAGTMEIGFGAQATIDGNSVIDLSDPYDPNIKGKIDCKGLLKVVEKAKILNAEINVTKAVFKDKAEIKKCKINVDSKAPYGQVFAEPNTSFVDVNIYADGDRYMDLEPSIFDGNFVNVRIFVTITEGVGKPFGGLFECRGEDGLADVNSFDPNNPFFCKANSGTIPDCNLSTWTLEKLELVANAKLNLTNRFPFQPPYDQGIDYNDVVYVKELILRQGSVLNLSFNKLYYDNLIIEPNAVIKNMPLLGFSMINIALDDQTEFIVRVTHNNYVNPNNQNYNRVHVERVPEPSLDPNGVMRMRTLKDKDPCSPTYQHDVNACAKGTFAKTSESEDVAIEFEYMFTADPCADAELVVYLSDDPELGQNLWEVARLRPPALGRPGSIGGNRFAVFSGLFPPDGFDFIRGSYIELRLLGSAGASCLINNWDPRVNCIGICGDFNIEEPFPLNIVDIYDYLALLAESGLCNPGGVGKACLDLIADRCVNNNDLLAWGTDELLHACGGGALAASTSVTGKALLTVPASESQGDSETEPLLIFGKPSSGTGTEVPSGYLYSVNTIGVCNDVNQTNSAGRLVTDSDGNVYQIDGYLGLINLETQTAVIEPDTIVYEGSSVLVGYNSGEGLLLSDAVFKRGDSNIVYVVPVQVNPLDGNCPYMAAAKLQLTGGGNYNLLQLYGKNPAADPCQHNTVTDCDGDILYEPDVQHLHEIEIDSEGNLFVLSSDWFNENNWLLVYDEAIGNISEVRLSLTYTNIIGPTAMVVSPFADMLYLTSSSGGSGDLISKVYRFSIDMAIPGQPNLVLNDIVEINCPAPSVCDLYPSMCDPELGYVSMITSMIVNPGDDTLYVTGYTAPKFPDNAVMSSWPYNQVGGIFTTPMLAEVPASASEMIEAVNITNADLVLPLSLAWTQVVTQEKCGGADLDGSGDVGLSDLDILVSYWLETNCGSLDDCDGADLEPQDLPDGDVDMFDFAVLAEHWFETGCLD